MGRFAKRFGWLMLIFVVINLVIDGLSGSTLLGSAVLALIGAFFLRFTGVEDPAWGRHLDEK